MLKNHISKNPESQNIGHIYTHRFFRVESTQNVVQVGIKTWIVTEDFETHKTVADKNFIIICIITQIQGD